MKKYFLDKNINVIKKYYSYDEVKISEIRYGLETLYITITKTIVIFLLAYLLNIIKELLLLMIFYSILRATGHGLHAKKSWQCWISSIIGFLFIPYLIKLLEFNLYSKILICLVGVILVFIYSPADTEKKPIINKKKRLVLKLITTFVSIIYSIIILIIKDNLIINSLIFSIILQNILMLPISYKIFNLKYRNYKNYLKVQNA